MGFGEVGDFQRAHRQWLENSLTIKTAVRDDRWSEAIAVGSLAFVEQVKSELGVKAVHREVVHPDGTYALRETSEAYMGKLGSESDALRQKNTIPWNENAETAET